MSVMIVVRQLVLRDRVLICRGCGRLNDWLGSRIYNPRDATRLNVTFGSIDWPEDTGSSYASAGNVYARSELKEPVREWTESVSRYHTMLNEMFITEAGNIGVIFVHITTKIFGSTRKRVGRSVVLNDSLLFPTLPPVDVDCASDDSFQLHLNSPVNDHITNDAV